MILKDFDLLDHCDDINIITHNFINLIYSNYKITYNINMQFDCENIIDRYHILKIILV